MRVLQVTRIDGTVESPPCLKVTQRSFGSQNSNTDIMFYRLSMPIECSEAFLRSPGGTLAANGSFFSPKRDLEDFETVSDFEVLMKTPHSHVSSNGPDRDRDEFNNHKDHNQEKPSKIKQRWIIQTQLGNAFGKMFVSVTACVFVQVHAEKNEARHEQQQL